MKQTKIFKSLPLPGPRPPSPCRSSVTVTWGCSLRKDQAPRNLPLVRMTSNIWWSPGTLPYCQLIFHQEQKTGIYITNSTSLWCGNTSWAMSTNCRKSSVSILLYWWLFLGCFHLFQTSSSQWKLVLTKKKNQQKKTTNQNQSCHLTPAGKPIWMFHGSFIQFPKSLLGIMVCTIGSKLSGQEMSFNTDFTPKYNAPKS